MSASAVMVRSSISLDSSLLAVGPRAEKISSWHWTMIAWPTSLRQKSLSLATLCPVIRA